MTHIYFVRHAQTDQNHNPTAIGGRSNHIEIREHGHQQGEALARRLRSESRRADVIYSSPAIRTLQTAQYVIDGTGYTAELQQDDRLQELDQGERTGQPRNEIYTPEVIASFHANPWDSGAPGGETMRQVGTRMNQFLDEIVQKYPQGHVRVISHGVAIAAMMMVRFAMTGSRIKMFPVANTSITHLSYDPQPHAIEQWMLMTYSDAAHIQGGEVTY